LHRLSAPTLWYVNEAVVSFLGTLAFTVTAVYYVTQVGMSPLELVLVGTVMEVSIFVFEVPTGIVADVYSRRLSVVIGTFVMGVAVMLFGALGDVWPILAANALWGFGYTFTSGSLDAWLADEVGDARLAGVYLRGAQVARVAALCGIGVSVGLAFIDLRVPIIVAGAGGVLLALFLALRMPETGFAPLPREERGSFAQMAHTGAEGVRVVRGRPALLAILGIAAFAGMWSEGFDRLWQAHFLRDIGLPSLGGLDPVAWFGVFGAGTILLSIAVAAPLGKRIERAGLESMARTLFWLDASLLVSALVFGLAGRFWLALAAYFATGLARNVARPIFGTWLNRNIDDSGVRATVLSITNQADAVGQWTGGPAIGLIGNAFSIRAALSAGALCMAPALWLYRRAARHRGVEPELEDLSSG
jgi:DHA3 family tetracycline resistance protein-like MFS transporter